MYSQNNEDQIIAEIFEKIGTKNKVFVEIGAGDGSECNTRALREQGWKGVAIDKAYENEHVIKKKITQYNVFDTVRILESKYFDENVLPIEFLSIDIDSNDYYILHELLKRWVLSCLPRVICIEYNKHFGDKNIVMGYDEDYEYDGLTYDYGASKTALIKLCEHYGYEFWGTDENEVNCFFVHKNA